MLGLNLPLTLSSLLESVSMEARVGRGARRRREGVHAIARDFVTRERLGGTALPAVREENHCPDKAM
jgi:hypothetical protein